MRYQRLTEDSSIIITESGESQLVSSSLNTNRNICQTRKFLLRLLLIEWIFSVLLCFIDASLFTKHTDDAHRQAIRSLVPILISFVYYTCGYIVVYLYHHLGIYMFVWLGMLQYLSLCFEVLRHTVSIVRHPSHDQEIKSALHLDAAISVISLLQAVLMVVAMKLTFKLLRLMKNFRRDVLEQM